ncbi:hypothetical protein Taro_003306, partial [Colocasia esculenta]|nr:hypothetical protein [Colocasia esculenta]
LKFIAAMASRGRRGGVPAREGEQRREELAEQQAPAPQGPVHSPPPPVDYGVFMQGLVQAMQTQAHTQATLQAQLEAQQAQVPAQDHGGPSIMERFKRMLPPSFKGESDPLLAESWMREIEKIFRAIRCADEDKMVLMNGVLQERADVWWASLLRTRSEDGAVDVAWDEFVRLFRAKFVPEYIQDRMEQEFLSLTQGSMTVLEYEARFAKLSKYAPHIVTDERRKAKKFVMGLKPSLRTRLVAFDHRTLDEALSAACRQEGEMQQYLEEKKASQKRPAATFQRQDKKKVVYQAPQRPVTTNSVKQPQDQGLSETLAGSPARSASPSSGSSSSASYRKTRKASSPSSSVCSSPQGRRAGGACHRRQLSLESSVESEELEVPLSVHTPAGMVSTRKCIPSLPVCIEDRVLDGCFFLLKMKDYDAILGLDWLEEHYALVDCRGKKIVFRIPGEDEFSHPLPRNLAGKLVISSMKAMRMVNNGYDAFLASVVIEQQKADPRLLELVGKAGIARDEDASWSLEEGFPDSNLLWRSTKNPEQEEFGGFLGLPKESFISIFEPFEDLFRGKGDFNCVTQPAEKIGGRITNMQAMVDFNAFMNASSLTDVGHIGSQFTWSNNRTGQAVIKARLDRFLMNRPFLNNFLGFFVRHLTRGPSDHAPLLASFENEAHTPARFTFQAMWTSHNSFLDTVKMAWNVDMDWHPNPFTILFLKLKPVKKALRLWNKIVLGNVEGNVLRLEDEVRAKQDRFDTNSTPGNRSTLGKASASLKRALHCMESFWAQKARMDWLGKGDRNSAFYHAVVQGNRRRNKI